MYNAVAIPNVSQPRRVVILPDPKTVYLSPENKRLHGSVARKAGTDKFQWVNERPGLGIWPVAVTYRDENLDIKVSKCLAFIYKKKHKIEGLIVEAGDMPASRFAAFQFCLVS